MGHPVELVLSTINFEIDKRKGEQMRPMDHIKLNDVPFHLRAGYEKEVMDMLEAGIIQKCEVANAWNTKAFPVAKSDGTSCRLVGDWRGVNQILKKLLHHTKRCDHFPADSRVFSVISSNKDS